MDQHLLIQVKVACKVASDQDLGYSLRVVNGSMINSYNYPFTTITALIDKENPLELLLFQHQLELNRFSIDPSSLSFTKAIQHYLNFGSPTPKISISYAILLLDQQDQSTSPSISVFKKFIEDLKDINSLKNSLLESLDQLKLPWNNAFEEVGIDLTLLNSTENISRQEAEMLKNTVLGLNEKLKILNLVEVLIKETEKHSGESLVAREEMQEELRRNCREFKGIQDQQTELVRGMEMKVRGKQAELDVANCKIRELEIVITDLNGKIRILEGDKEKLTRQVKNFEDMDKFIRNLQKNIKELEENRESMREGFKKMQAEYDILIDIKDKEFQNVQTINGEYQQKIEAQQSNIMELKTTIEGLQTNILNLSSNLDSRTAEVTALKDQEAKAISMEALAKKHQQECMKSQDSMQKTTAKFSEVVKNINQEKIKHLKSSFELQGKITALDDSIKTLEEKLNIECYKSAELKSRNESLQSTIYLSIDSQHISKSLLRLYSEFSKAKTRVQLDNLTFFKALSQSSSELLISNRIIEQLKEIIESRDNEILILKDIITELQRKIPYLPVKDDPIDIAMAEYVNSLEEPMDIPFVREDQGIYLFGSKKIFVKLDNGKLSIRVGGGAILLDEFVDSYTSGERAKLESRRRKKSTGQKNLMGKILEKISKTYAAGEKIKGQDLTANKAAKVILEITSKNRSLIQRSQTKVSEGSRSPTKQSSRNFNAFDRS